MSVDGLKGLKLMVIAKFLLKVYLYGIPLFYLLTFFGGLITPMHHQKYRRLRKSQYQRGYIISAIMWPIIVICTIISMLIYGLKEIFLFVMELI
jgi:hypothetical protein